MDFSWVNNFQYDLFFSFNDSKGDESFWRMSEIIIVFVYSRRGFYSMS